MASEQEPDNVIELRPTAEDMSRLAAVGTSLEDCFRPSDAYPIKFPDLEPGQYLVFDFDFDGDEPGEIESGFKVCTTQEEMCKCCAAVRLNIVGVVGWRIAIEPQEPAPKAE